MKNKEVNMKDLINLIDKIDNMKDMNNVISSLKIRRAFLQNELARKAKASFSVGDTVNIDSKKENLVGVITKINRTRAICDINGSSYNVPFSIMAVAS